VPSSLLFSSIPSPPPVLSTLPYTTLFRSLVEDVRRCVVADAESQVDHGAHRLFLGCGFEEHVEGGELALRDEVLEHQRPALLARSEEHTSELQSLRHLVCRLLLEKKKGPH